MGGDIVNDHSEKQLQMQEDLFKQALNLSDHNMKINKHGTSQEVKQIGHHTNPHMSIEDPQYL